MIDTDVVNPIKTDNPAFDVFFNTDKTLHEMLENPGAYEIGAVLKYVFENANHWISVKDRLPTEKDGAIHSTNVGEVGKPELWRYVKILAVFPATEYEPAYVAETKFFVEKERREYAIPFTHWQPLPPLPKGKPDNNFCVGGVYPKNRWHYPSKGEFPEEFKLVAVSIKGFDYTTTGLYVQKKEGRYTRFVDEWLCQIPYHAGEYRSNEDILAWQYLPEPQKEAENA